MSKFKKKPIYENGSVVGFEVKEKELQLRLCKKKEADELIIKNHYSHKTTQNSFLSFLVYYKGNIEGAIQIGFGIKPKTKIIEGVSVPPEQVREFDRMYLTDVCPKFSETIVISLLHNFLKTVYPEIKYLISYSDNSDDVGNEGIIYKASNYKLIDRIKSDFYLLPTGERIHPVSMWHRHGTRKWEFLQSIYEGIKKASGFQLKYLYRL